ncbi:MAG: hypothetical protein H0T46_01810 [Deltaproteobacteria bacterium]|nr:hypothetical protein [Deltaproteobacteria bacterium]
MLSRDARDSAAGARKLATITVRAEWTQEKEALQGAELKLQAALREREADAAVSEKAREDYQTAKRDVEELTRVLATAQQPRVKPPISRELELEPQIGSMPAVEVFAWAVGLSPAERTSLAQRLREATTVHRSTDRDTFAIALANHLARSRDLHQFQSVLADPARFNLAAFLRDQQVRSGGSNAAPATTTSAPTPQPDAARPDVPAQERGVESGAGSQTTAAAMGAAVEHQAQDPDAVLRRVLDGHGASPATTPLDASAFAPLDPSTRRSLTRRLRGYRPGRGDELGARFARLAVADQQAIYGALDAPTSETSTKPSTQDAAPVPSAEPAGAAPAPATLLSDSIETSSAAPIAVPDALQLKPEASTGAGVAARPANDHTEKEPPRPDSALRAYVMRNIDDLWNAARTELAVMSFPTATAQFAWKDPKAFADTVLGAMHDVVLKQAKAGDLSPLDELVYPARMTDELTPMVPFEQREDEKTAALERAAKRVDATVPTDKKTYVQSVARVSIPSIGLRFAQLLKSAIAGSTVRMTGRYVDAMNDRARAGLTAHDANVRLTERDLITSRPVDRFVGLGLVTPNESGALVGEVVPDPSVKPTGRTTLRRPKLTWQGMRDKRFWCWVQADLPDATPEEVAAVMFAYLGGEPRTYLAYGFAQAGSLFGLPASWAIQFAEARDSAPESVRQGKLPDPANDTIASRLMLIAGSDQADAIALQQAAKTPLDAGVDVPQVLAANEDVIVQPAALRSVLTPWGLAGDLIPIVMHAVTTRDTLRSAQPSEIMAYAAVALGQRERLGRISGSITNTIAAGKQFPGRDADNPVHGILARYAQAAATAQLADVSDGLVADAQTMQRGLVVKSLQANQLAAMQAIDEMRAGPAMRDPKAPKDDRDWMDKQIDTLEGKGDAQRGGSKNSAAEARKLGALNNNAQERARVLENTLLAGGEVDADELQRVQLEAQEVALRARLESLNAQLDLVADEAAAAENAGLAAKLASLPSGKFRGLRDLTLHVRAQLVTVRRDLLLDPKEALKAATPKQGDGDGLTPPQFDVVAKRDALTKAQGGFEALSRDYELRTFVEKAYSLVDDQRFRTMLVNMAAMMGISFGGASLASAIAKGAGRAMTSAEGVATVAELSLGARAGMFAMKVATETLVSASGQVVMTGDSAGKALAENALLSLGMEGTASLIAKDVAVARAWHKALDTQLARIASVEAKAAMRASSTGTVATLIGREAIGISGEAVMGMALGALSHEVLAQLNGSGTAQAGAVGDINSDAIIQGASVAIGRLVHARIGQRRDAMDALARKSATPQGKQLGAHARQLEKLTTLLVSRPAAERAQAALDVLDHQARLIDEEIRVIDELLTRADHGGYSADDLARTKAELVGQRASAGDAAMLTTKFHLMGLREHAPGTLWRGTPAEVAQAVAEVRETQPGAQVRETEPGVTTAKLGDREITFHAIAEPTQATPTTAGANKRPVDATKDSADKPTRAATDDEDAAPASARDVNETGPAPKSLVERTVDRLAAGMRGLGDRASAIGDRGRREAHLVDAGEPLPSTKTPRASRARAEQVRAQVDAKLAELGVPGGSYRVEVLPDAKYAKRFGEDRGPAAMIIEHDQPTVYASERATPEDIAHEAMHVAQLRDGRKPEVAASIRILSDETLNAKRWKQADAGYRKELFEHRLIVEIDAAERQLEKADGEARAQLEREIASMREQQNELAGITVEQLLMMKAGAAPLPAYLQDPAFLFAPPRSVVSGNKLNPFRDEARPGYNRTPVDDGPAAKRAAKDGTTVFQVGERWREAVVVTSTYTGVVTKIDRTADATIVHVKEASGKVHFYTGEKDATVAVTAGDPVAPGTPVLHERSREYRLLDVGGEHIVEEKVAKRGWQQGGDFVRTRGYITEDAARLQVDAELDAKMKEPPGENHLTSHVRLDNQTGSGAGFDDVIVEFAGDPNRPTAKIRIIETKDNPNSTTRYEHMTAIRTNLETNYDRLRRDIDTALTLEPDARKGKLRDLSAEQLIAMQNALISMDVSVELRLGPTTRVTAETMARLRADLRRYFNGKDVLKADAVTVRPEFVDEATRNRFPDT